MAAPARRARPSGEVRERRPERREVRASAAPIAIVAWVPTQNGQSRAETARCRGADAGQVAEGLARLETVGQPVQRV